MRFKTWKQFSASDWLSKRKVSNFLRCWLVFAKAGCQTLKFSLFLRMTFEDECHNFFKSLALCKYFEPPLGKAWTQNLHFRIPCEVLLLKSFLFSIRCEPMEGVLPPISLAKFVVSWLFQLKNFSTDGITRKILSFFGRKKGVSLLERNQKELRKTIFHKNGKILA